MRLTCEFSMTTVRFFRRQGHVKLTQQGLQVYKKLRLEGIIPVTALANGLAFYDIKEVKWPTCNCAQ